MLDGNRRGYMIADEIIGRMCLLPGATSSELAKGVYTSLKARGYAQIDPEEGFVRSFVDRWNQSYSRITQEVSQHGTTQLSQ